MRQKDIHPSAHGANVRRFLDTLKQHDGRITRQEYKTIRGQAIAGDIDGATKGLNALLGERAGSAAP